jgi:two-component system, NtrC family, sensor kinase
VYLPEPTTFDMHTQNIPELTQILLEYTPVAIAMFDREMRYIAVSRKWLVDHNCTEQYLIGNCNCKILPSIAQRWKEIHNRCLTGESHQCEAEKIIQADGSYEWLKWECRPWYDGKGEVGGTIFCTEVITEQKQTQEALRKSQARVTKLAANVPGMMFQYVLHLSGNTELLYVSNGCRQLLEVEPEKLQHNSAKFYDLIHPEDYPAFTESMAISADTLLPWLWEGRIITTTGKLKWVRTSGRPEKQDSGNIIWDGLIIDVTDKKLAEAQLNQYKELLESLVEKRTSELNTTNTQLQAEIVERQKAEAALRKSENRFQKLSANIPGVLYQYVLCPDGANYFSYINAVSRQIYELEPEQILNDSNILFKQIHPEDLPGFYQSIQVSVQTLEPWNHEWRTITPSGKLKWLQGSSRPEKQPNGDIVWDGLVMDVTERKRAEEALKHSESKLRTIFDRSADGILIYDAEVFIDCNLAAAQMMGCSTREQLMGLAPSEISPEYQADGITSVERAISLTQQAFEQGSIRFEWIIQRVDRKLMSLEVVLTAIPLDGKEVFYCVWRDITDRKQAEEALKQSESKLRTIFDKSADGILIYDAEVFIDCNLAAAQMMGCSTREQLMGLAPSEISPEYQADGITSVERAISLTQQAFEQESIRFEWVIQRVDKKLLPLEVVLTAIPLDGKEVFYCVWRDITDRKQAEEALQQSELRFRELARREQLINQLANQIRNTLDLDTILETAITSIQSILKIDRCSFSWFKPNVVPPVWETLKEAKLVNLPSLLGCHSAEKIGPVSEKFIKQEILQINDVKEFREPIHKQFLEELGIKSEIVLPMKTRSEQIGVIVCGHWTETRPWTKDEVELLQAVVDQLSIAINQADLYAQSQKAAIKATQQAQQIERALEELKRTQTQLVQSEKMSSLGQLVAGVAHEINNPVNFIYGNLAHASNYAQDLINLLKLYQQEYPEPSHNIISEINTIDLDFMVEDLPKIMFSMKVGSERIREIVQSLRTFSRLDEAEMKKVNVHEGIESTLLILQHRLKPKQEQQAIQLVQNYAMLPKVVCYAGQLNQVFMNLLVNAIDALEDGMKKGIVSNPTITIATEMIDNEHIAIHIADNGVGMAPETQQRLFDPFFTTKPVGVGTGLGLSISYQIVVDRHGGHLHCNSEIGKGTEFIIEIPATQAGNT